MESTGNWIVDILNYTLSFWSDALRTIWDVLTTSPQNFRGGTVWRVMSGIQGGLKGIAYALLVLFFLVGVVRTTTNFAEIKRPEVALKLFIRFAVAKAVGSHDRSLSNRAGHLDQHQRPCRVFHYRRSPGSRCDPAKNNGMQFSGQHSTMDRICNRRFADLCPVVCHDPDRVLPLLQAVHVHGCRACPAFILCGRGHVAGRTAVPEKLRRRLSAGRGHHYPTVATGGDATSMVWSWLLQTIFYFLVLVGAVKMSDRVVKEMIGF